MAIANLLATRTTVKVDGVSFSSSFCGKPKHYLARPLLQTTRRVQTSCCYHVHETSSLKALTSLEMPKVETSSDGIGITKFLKGKSYLITGATGFLGKVLVEKLLRTSPETTKIFVLMRSKDQESANKKLYDELISSDLFKVLKQIHGNSYEAFMKSKLIPVVGDIGETKLGIRSEITDKISEEIDVIISCGGRTVFDDRYDSALSVNALGPDRLLSFGKGCKKLKLFLHFSTAYVTGKREGTVLESPLCIGENMNIESELKLAAEAVRKFHGSEETKKLKELGIERAQHFGWDNTYTFTKAIGETVIQSKLSDFPVVIIRPSIIESSYKEPFPGWLQGLRMADPIVVAYAKGQISNFWRDSQSLLDVIPVDMVVNAAIAAMAKHGCGVTELKVYNVTSSSHSNPMRAGTWMDLSHQHLRESPIEETMKDLARMTFHSTLEDFITKQEREINNGGRELSMKEKRKLNYIVSLARTYEPYTFFQARFDDSNTRSLMQKLSLEESKMFEFDARDIDWEHYIVNVHLPGLKRQILSGKI